MSDDLDAFGRKKGDDSLGDLGWGTSTSGSGSTPSPAPTPVDPGGPTPNPTMSAGQREMPVVVRQRSGGGGVRLVVVLAVLIAAGGGIIGLVSGANDVAKVKIPKFTFPTTTSSGNTTTTTGSNPENSKPPPQVKPLQLLTPGGLKAALKILERDVPGKIDNFRLAPDRIDVIVVRGNKRTIAQVTPDAEVANKIAVQDNPIPLTDALSYDQIDTGAPARLIRSSNERVNQSRDDVDYLVWGFAGNNQWNLYYKHGVYTEGDAHGRFVRRIS